MPLSVPTIIAIRLPLILALNHFLWAASFVLSLGLRFDWDFQLMGRVGYTALPLLLLLLYRSAAYIYWNLNSGYWRYASTDDLVRIVKAHGASSVFFAATIWLAQIGSFPRSVFFIEFAFSILLCGGSRFFVRLAGERWLIDRRKNVSTGLREVLVIGGGDSGHVVVKTLQANRRLGYRTRLILDDNPRLQGVSVSGVPVTGRLHDLPDLLEAHPQIAAVIVAIPSLSRAKYDSIVEICGRVSVPVKRLQSFEDIALMDALTSSEGISVESILERDYTVEHEQIIGDSLRGRAVVVTGAAGSIGSELVRQILPFQPSSLMLIDNNEYHMYRIQAEVQELYPAVHKHFCIASIGDQKRVTALFQLHRPEVLFHAAAYKHVPLMEENVYEAFFNNVVGTKSLLLAAIASGVRHFILISTDKAVNSCSVMGHSKRLCELLVQSYTAGENGMPAAAAAAADQTAAEAGDLHPTRARSNAARTGTSRMTSAIVRFGNVINSNGSVLPRFSEQIMSGGPVTVTHPEMMRYFMSIREAVRLVLAAGTLGRNGEIFILDMGKPVKIVDVARKMLALYGRRDISIVYTGMRPGERLFEDLTGPNEDRLRTNLSKVDRVTSKTVFRQDVREWVAELERSVDSLSNAELARQMSEFLRPTGAPGVERRPAEHEAAKAVTAAGGD